MADIFEIMIGAKVPSSVLAKVVADAFDIACSALVIDEDFTQQVAHDVKIYATVISVEGKFPLHLTVYVRSPEIDAKIRHIAGSISTFFKCACLIPDDDIPDLDAMLLIKEFAAPEKVQMQHGA